MTVPRTCQPHQSAVGRQVEPDARLITLHSQRLEVVQSGQCRLKPQTRDFAHHQFLTEIVLRDPYIPGDSSIHVVDEPALTLGLCPVRVCHQVFPGCLVADGADGEVLGSVIVKPHQGREVVPGSQAEHEGHIGWVRDVTDFKP